ncbi:MAG: hypothetical protein FWD68_15990 [Alphaproteobacteria bacterium]|nr:hypothetical protein [Alphaproteobacteria bacterium]
MRLVKPSHPPQPSNLITEDGRYPIDLTGPQSHVLVMEPGVGSLSIGPAALGRKADLHVEPDQPINWAAFDCFATPMGSPWPRWLDYTGADTGFFFWARASEIEIMYWTPILSEDSTVDAGSSRIRCLNIHLDHRCRHLHLVLPEEKLSLCVEGDLARFEAAGHVPRSVKLAPATGRTASGGCYLLPDMGILHQVTSLSLRNAPMAQPVSLECLSRFSNLKSLDLYGSFIDLDQLAGLPGLESLGLRFMPDLDGLPDLSTLPKLDYLIAFNVEETAGKRLRRQVRARASQRPSTGQGDPEKDRKTGYFSVSQLRKAEWWAAEFGRPFSAWPKRSARVANEAYDAALKALAGASSIAEAQAAFTRFIMRFNKLKGIETPEREDLGDAVCQLSQTDDARRLGVTEEMAQDWFDQVRDY